VTALNAGELRIIWKSRKKTEEEFNELAAGYPKVGMAVAELKKLSRSRALGCSSLRRL
jgi:hypothetical protein